MVVSAAGGGHDDDRVRFRLGEGRGGEGREGDGGPEERLGNWGGGPILQGPNQRHSHTFTV